MNSFRRWAKSKTARALALGVISAMLVLGADQLGWLRTAENRSLDWRFRNFLQPGQASRDIVIVALDDTSFDSQEMLDNFGRWPWRRQLYAGLVFYLLNSGARAVALDLVFQGADPHAGDDAQFSQVLKDSSHVVLAFTLNEGRFREKDPATREGMKQLLARYALPGGRTGKILLPSFTGIDLPLGDLVGPQTRLGCVTIQADSDGLFRRVTPLFQFQGNLYPSFPLAVAGLATGQPLRPSVEFGGGPSLIFAGRPIPLDPEGRMLIRWYGPAYAYKRYSVWEVFNSVVAYDQDQKPMLPPETFKGKIVLIGPTAVGTSDLHPNPFSENYAGVEIHATVIDNLLRGDFLRQTPPSVEVMGICGMALLMAGVVYLFDSALIYTLLALLGTLAYGAVVCWLFRSQSLWAPLVGPLVAGTTAFAGSTLTRYATEGREKRKYRKTLMRYLSPQLVETIMQDFNWASLRAEKRTLTVLFSDVRGFTTFSEKYPPETVIATLNEHLNMMVSVIFNYQGTLDKFVGDCVMAFWGAPIPQPNQAELAARAALAMIEGLEKLNEKWQSEGRPTLKIGVGINTGEMLFGNIGSEQRMDFTVIGDSVNLGARLESATKELHASIVISDATYQQIRSLARVRPLGEISVKGKEEKITVYELLGMAGAIPRKEATP